MVLIAKNQTAGKYVPNISQHHPCHDMQGHRVRWIMPGQDPRILEGPQSNEAKSVKSLDSQLPTTLIVRIMCKDSESWQGRAIPSNAMQCWYLGLSTPSTLKINSSESKARQGVGRTATDFGMRLGTTRDTKESSTWKDNGREIPPRKKNRFRARTWNPGLWRWCLATKKCMNGPSLKKNCNMFGAILRKAQTFTKKPTHQEGKAKIKSTVCVYEGVGTYRHTRLRDGHILCHHISSRHLASTLIAQDRGPLEEGNVKYSGLSAWYRIW